MRPPGRKPIWVRNYDQRKGPRSGLSFRKKYRRGLLPLGCMNTRTLASLIVGGWIFSVRLEATASLSLQSWSIQPIYNSLMAKMNWLALLPTATISCGLSFFISLLRKCSAHAPMLSFWSPVPRPLDSVSFTSFVLLIVPVHSMKWVQ